MPEEVNKLSRREFAALSLAAGVIAVSGANGASPAEMQDSDVQVKTPAGACDAALVHPEGGSFPGVILFTDVFGLRPTMREMARRLAADGYAVLVPNPFYRSSKPPGLSTDIDFDNLADRAKMAALRAPLTREAVMQDARAYVGFLDSHPVVDKKAAMRVFGYCMGGPMALQAAAANPERIGAGASFHGGGLVTDKPDSPHLSVSAMRARFYVAIAANDDARQPDAKSRLDQAFKTAKLRAKIDVYGDCQHGWCVKDMPQPPEKPPIYDEAQAERAWKELITVMRQTYV